MHRQKATCTKGIHAGCGLVGMRIRVCKEVLSQDTEAAVTAVTNTAECWCWEKQWFDKGKRSSSFLPSPWLVQSALDKVAGLGKLHFLQSDLLLEMPLNFGYNMLSQCSSLLSLLFFLLFLFYLVPEMCPEGLTVSI